MTKYFLISIAVLLIIAGVAILWMLFRNKNTSRSLHALTVGSHTYQVELADSMLTQAQGLSDRDSLATDHGMLFRFSSERVPAFWMRGMRFALDMVWISDGKVVELSENIQPDGGAQIDRPHVSVNWVLELNAGAVAKDGIKAGDNVILKS